MMDVAALHSSRKLAGRHIDCGRDLQRASMSPGASASMAHRHADPVPLRLAAHFAA